MDPDTINLAQSEASLHPPPVAEKAPDPSAAGTNTEGACLEKVLPQIKDLARQVGGYRNLIALIRQLDQGS
jgi:hypothetical protein